MNSEFAVIATDGNHNDCCCTVQNSVLNELKYLVEAHVISMAYIERNKNNNELSGEVNFFEDMSVAIIQSMDEICLANNVNQQCLLCVVDSVEKEFMRYSE